MIRQRTNLPLTLPSDAAHLIITEQCKITGAPIFTLIPPSSQFLKFYISCFFIHGEYNNVLIPCVFALMERKTEIMYRRVSGKSEKMLNQMPNCHVGF
ncbi:hypothetical protein HZS_2193 [Henneguya salminicola]|nr:hypothetical protein HZS_2193 [Henneguya salminicola]